MNSTLSQSKRIIWAVWTIASVFYGYQYLLRVMPSIMLEDIMAQFDMGAAAFGQFSGIYYIGYSLLHLPVGIMLDRFGPRKMMSACILLTIIGMMPLLFATHWAFPILGRFLTGVGSSAAILGVFKIVRMTFAESRFTRMLSFSVTIGLLGAIYGGGPLSYMNETYGYQTVIMILSAAGAVLAALTYWLIPELESAPERTVLSDIREVLSNRKVLGTCIFAGLMVGPVEGFADIWGPAFLKHVYGLEGTVATSLPSLIFIGMCFGGPLLSFIAEKAGYLATIIGAALAMAFLFIAMETYHLSPGIVSFSFLVVGACSAYQILAIYKASTYVRGEVAGLTTAVANMIIMVFGYAFHSTIGGVVNAMGGPADASALLFGLSVIPAGLILASIGWTLMLVQEKHFAKAPSKKALLKSN